IGLYYFFFSSRRRHTRFSRDWSSDVCSSDLAALRPGVSRLLPQVGTLFRGHERETLRQHVARLVGQGVPEDVADWATRVMYGFGLIDIVEVTRAVGGDPAGDAVDEVAGIYFVLSQRFRVDTVLSKISELPRDDRWQALARMALRYDLYAALAALPSQVLASTASGRDSGAPASERARAHASPVTRVRNAVAQFDGSRADLAALSVLLRQVRTLVRTATAS